MHSLPPYHQQNYRDPSTLRGVVHDSYYGPPPAVPTESKMGGSLLVAAIGMIIGGVVGVVALRNAHAAIPTRSAAIAPIVTVATPATPAQIPTSAPTESQPQAPTVGTVTVDGPAGALVFDGDQQMGKAPITFSTSLGYHLVRVEDAKSKQKTTTGIQVTDKAVSNVHVEFAKRGRLVRIKGGATNAAQTDTKDDSKTDKGDKGGPSQADVKAAENALRDAKDANSLGGGT